MSNFNEIVNKYVDNELNKEELNKVDELLNSNEEFKNTLTLHRFVHDSLHDIPLKLAPSGFTDLVMNKIVTPLSDKYKANYFFRFIIAAFSLIFVFMLFWFFYFVGDLELTKNVVSYTNNYSDRFLPSIGDFTNFIKTDIFKTITGVVGFIILIGFYYNMNSHKALKERLEKF